MHEASHDSPPHAAHVPGGLVHIHLFCQADRFLGWNGSMLHGYRQYMTAMSLYEIGKALLLVGVLFSAIIEDAQEKR